MLSFIYGDEYYGNRRKNKEKKKRTQVDIIVLLIHKEHDEVSTKKE